jgi:vacuolar-type H+-ATPase subunit C/Vma6
MSTDFPAATRPRSLSEVPFEFLSAKLRGRRSLLYEGDRLRELCGEKSIHDLAFRLFPREDIRDEIGLEQAIISAAAAELCHFADYLSGPYALVYSALVRRFAVDNLKVILRLVHSGRAGDSPGGPVAELPRSCSPALEGLLESPDVRAFVQGIPFRDLREAAAGVLPLYGETGRAAYVEMALDRAYWTAVLEAAGHLRAADRGSCMAPVHAEAAAAAVFGTVRAAATYEIPQDRWDRLVPPAGDRPSRAALHALYSNPTPEHVVENMAWLFAGEAVHEAADLAALEDAAWRRCVRLANRQYYAPTPGPAVLIGYYYLKRRETRSLLGLSQLLRYNTPQPEILEFLGL